MQVNKPLYEKYMAERMTCAELATSTLLMVDVASISQDIVVRGSTVPKPRRTRLEKDLDSGNASSHNQRRNDMRANIIMYLLRCQDSDMMGSSSAYIVKAIRRRRMLVTSFHR
jgi:hypothetical protein